MRSVIFGLALIFTGASHAAVIDFDSQSLGSISSPLIIGDFQFFPSGADIIQESPGDNALSLTGSGSTSPFGNDAGPLIISMTAVGGGSFAFYGADVSGTSLNGTADSGYFGIVTGGSYPLGPFAAGPVGTGDWLNVERVQFEVYSYDVVGGFDTLSLTIDNVNASVVPVPAAFWLFGSALFGLGWLRRK